jgi:hypothetical protein
MMFARPIDMEPGMMFRCPGHGRLLEFRGVEHRRQRVAGGRQFVRVLVGRGGVDFTCDRNERFPVLDERR